MSKHVTETDINNFLESKLNLQIATIDEEGYPMIQPTCFLYDKNSAKIYLCTEKATKKTQNIMRNPDKVYFSIDDENRPLKGVKGRTLATISDDIQKNLLIMERISMKYLGTLEHPLPRIVMENIRKGTEVAIEITSLPTVVGIGVTSDLKMKIELHYLFFGHGYSLLTS